jgi:hypothetical protein
MLNVPRMHDVETAMAMHDLSPRGPGLGANGQQVSEVTYLFSRNHGLIIGLMGRKR